MLDDTLYDAFGQRQVSTIFTQLNQYHVVMEVTPGLQLDPGSLKDIYVKTSATAPGAGNPGGPTGATAQPTPAPATTTTSAAQSAANATQQTTGPPANTAV